MAVRIRLQRHGTKHAPVYRLVAADSRMKRDGRFLEILGTYRPRARGQDQVLQFKSDRINHWLSVGALPSDTAHALIKKAAALPTAPAADAEVAEAEAAAAPAEA